MDADVQGDYQAMSVSVNKRLLWPSRRKTINKSRQRSRMRFKAVHRHHKEGAGEFQVRVLCRRRSSCASVTHRTGWQSAAHPHQFAEEKQQKL